MEARSLFLVLVALTCPWWKRVLLALCREAYDASTPIEENGVHAPPGRSPGARAVAVESRAPLNRQLAFRGVELRNKERARWRGGFGRRGP